MIKANVIVDKIEWKKKLKYPDYYIKKKLLKISKILKLNSKKQEMSLLLTNSKKMRQLNFKFKKINKITDVLSFPILPKREK